MDGSSPAKHSCTLVELPCAISAPSCSPVVNRQWSNVHGAGRRDLRLVTRFHGQGLSIIHHRHARQPAKRVPAQSVMKESQPLQMGMRAPDFSLPEPLTGRVWSLDDFEGFSGLLVMFICNHCPFVIHVRKELIALAKKYSEKGIAVVAINSNSLITHPQDGPEMMAAAAQTHKLPFLYLFDESQEVAKAYSASCTPDFYVFKKAGRRPFELTYHGQVDDSRPSNGRPVTGRDLREALDCVISNRPVSFAQRPSIGCNIKWTPGNEPEYF